MSIGRKLWGVGVTGLLSALTVLPFIVAHDSIAAIGSDGWFIAAVLGNRAQFYSDLFRSLGANFSEIFSVHIFYPNTMTLAYSDMYFVSGLVSFFGSIVGVGWQSVWVLVLVTGQVGTGVVSYWWYRKLGAGMFGSWLGALAFLVSTIHLHYIVHLHTWNITWWLLGSGLVVFGLRDRNLIKGVVGAMLVGLQFWEAPMGGYFGLATILVMGWRFRHRILVSHLLLCGGTLLFVVVPVLIVYRQVALEENFVRTIRDAAHGGMSLDEVVTKFWSWSIVLPLVGLKLLQTKLPVVHRRSVYYLVVIGLVGLVLALGPVLKWDGETVKFFSVPIPLPYGLAYYLVPGFQAFREPSRWITLFGWALSGVIAVRMTSVRWSVVCVLVVMILGIGWFQISNIPRTALYTEATLPGVYQWLRQKPGTVVWEVPMGRDDVESTRMYTTLFTRVKLINGFSGFIPQRVQHLEQKSKQGVGVEMWKTIPADYLVIHSSELLFSRSVTEFADQIQYTDETYVVVGK